MVIDSKHPNDSFDSNSFSSEMMASDELIVDLDGFEGPLDLLKFITYSKIRFNEDFHSSASRTVFGFY